MHRFSSIRKFKFPVVLRQHYITSPEAIALATVSRVYPVFKDTMSLAATKTAEVNKWYKSIVRGSDDLICSKPCFQKLVSRFQMPMSLASAMFGPMFPRPEFLSDIDNRLVTSHRSVLYVGPSNLGKTSAVCGRFAYGGNQPPLGLSGVIYVSFREIPDDDVFDRFCQSVGIENKGAILIEEEFGETCHLFHKLAGRPVVLIIDDLHTPSLQKHGLHGEVRLTPRASQLMGMLVNLQGDLVNIITASDPIAIRLLQSVSGATARYDIVNFPVTKDDWLINGLRGVVIDEKDRPESADVEYLLSSGEFAVALGEKCVPSNQILFETQEECEYIVSKLGSHYGDLKVVLKMVVEMRRVQLEQNIPVTSKENCEVAVRSVVDRCLKSLSDAIVSRPQDTQFFTPEQFTTIAHAAFEALILNTDHSAIPIGSILTVEDRKAMNISTHMVRSVLDRLVLLNLVTYPSVVKPNTFNWCHRSLLHAWKKVREDADVKDAAREAKEHLQTQQE